jgi:hypothetical protein
MLTLLGMFTVIHTDCFNLENGILPTDCICVFRMILTEILIIYPKQNSLAALYK